MGGFFLFNSFIEGVRGMYPNFFGGGKGKGSNKPVSFKGYIFEVMDIYENYKGALNDNIYSFIEMVHTKRQINDNN